MASRNCSGLNWCCFEKILHDASDSLSLCDHGTLGKVFGPPPKSFQWHPRPSHNSNANRHILSLVVRRLFGIQPPNWVKACVSLSCHCQTELHRQLSKESDFSEFQYQSEVRTRVPQWFWNCSFPCWPWFKFSWPLHARQLEPDMYYEARVVSDESSSTVTTSILSANY